jgi:putative membrane protein
MHSISMVGFALMVLMIGASESAAQAAAQPSQKPAATSDNAFLTHAAQDGEAEVELGKMAQQKAADQRVKDFGARMQKDHGNANAELRAIIAKKGVTIPGGLGPHMAVRNKLEKLQGATFDEEYMKAMVEDHTKAVSLFEGAAKSADADIKAFATKTLPTLREHRQMAQELSKSVSSTMRSSPNAPAAGAGQGGATSTGGAAK